MPRPTERTWTALLLALYAAVLLASLNLTPLWLDEIQQFANSHHTTVAYLIQWAKFDVGSSPLAYLAQRAVVDALGYSVFSARLAAAICSVLSGVVFAALAPYFLKPARRIALAMFLILPLQFRYGTEGRIYSQGLLFALLSLWLFLRLREKPSAARAGLYLAAAIAGLYSEPLVAFPLLAEAAYTGASKDRRLRNWVWSSVAIAGLAYLPWYLAKQAVQAQIPHVTYFFSLRQIAPLVLLHDATGGGYACMLALLALAACSWKHGSLQPLLLVMIAFSVAGPIVMDAEVQYYFAARQILFALPALILLAAQGFERLAQRGRSARYLGLALAAVFAISSGIKDAQQAVTPKDDLDRTAQAIVDRLPAAGCLLAAPPEQAGYYTFLRPQLEPRVCGTSLESWPAILAVSGPYTSAAANQAMRESIPAGYRAGDPMAIGESRLTLYQR